MGPAFSDALDTGCVRHPPTWPSMATVAEFWRAVHDSVVLWVLRRSRGPVGLACAHIED